MQDISIALLCTILGVCVSLLTYRMNSKKDIRNDTREQVELKTKLDYISKGIDDIKLNDRVRDEELKKLNERMIIAESNIKLLLKQLNDENGR